MTLGRTLIVQPAGTDHLLRVRTYLSYNRRGLVFWSDGYMEGPHYPPVCEILMHDPIAGTPFFPSEAEEVGGQIDPLNRLAGELDEWDSVPFAETATETDYAHAIEFLVEDRFDVDDRERLSILRHHWWWTANQPRRKDPDLPLSKPARENMEAIIDMTTDATDYARLLRCELYRELSDFGKSLRELVSPFSRPKVEFAERLLLLNMGRHETLSSYRWNPYP